MMKRMFDSTTRRASTHRASSISAGPDLLRHRAAVVRWALAHGHPVDRDSLAAIINSASLPTPGQVGLHWTAHSVNTLLIQGCSNWCTAHGVRYPDNLSRTLTTYLRYLGAYRLLDADSDPMIALKRSVAEFDKEDREQLNQQLAKESTRGSAKSRHPTAQLQFLAPVLPLH